jgi:glutamate dehydrogenase/leucine dehydrogenase
MGPRCWPEERVNGELHTVLTRAYRAVCDLSKEHGITLRQAAYRIAVRRVADAIHLRGFV